MSQFIFKMPDLGEGTVDAEIVARAIKDLLVLRPNGENIQV